MPARLSLETIPAEALLEPFPPPNRELAERLRAIVLATVPDATERVRAGWRVIGFDLAMGRRSAFFAWILPQLEHVHLGFPQGSFLEDRRGVLEGAGITKRARWLTYAPGDSIDEAVAMELVRAAEGLARIPRDAFG
jgi:hypothetical protein